MATTTTETVTYNPVDRVKGSETASFLELQRRVKSVIDSSTDWERYQRDRAEIGLGYLLGNITGLLLLSSSSLLYQSLGILSLSWTHQLIAARLAHVLSHGWLRLSEWPNLIMLCFTESYMGFPHDLASDTHSKIHHPHTNIVGMGDSSSWRVPQLSRSLYLFIAPLLLPVISPLIGIKEAITASDHTIAKRVQIMVRFLTITALMAYLQWWIFQNICGLTANRALLFVWFCRAPYFIPYIHVNIFQHIGLAMYSPQNRPDRMTQMSTGVLNLPRNLLLDWNFGHSLISAHVEHHLFNQLSDYMCLKVQPTVKSYFAQHGLEYNERTYAKRVRLFWNDYDKLMVDEPYITELALGDSSL